MPVCSKCKEEKSIEEMSLDKSRKRGISSWCKTCRALSSRKWLAKNPGRIYKREEKPYLTNRDYSLRTRYGLSLEEYAKLLENQGNSCAICGRDALEMTYHLHVDHCHSTKEVRGLLCAPCNVYLGYIKDRPEVLQSAINYLGRKKK